MKLAISLIDWEYPADGHTPEPDIWDLSSGTVLTLLVLTFANNIIVELRAEGDSSEALDLLRSTAEGTGGYTPAELSEDEKNRLWLYRDGYECYRQNDAQPAYVFINPVPNPTLFIEDTGELFVVE